MCLITFNYIIILVVQPTSIEIVGRNNGSEAQVKATESISLECVVKGGKPAPDIVWYRNSFRLSDGKLLFIKLKLGTYNSKKAYKSDLSFQPQIH